MRSFPETDIDPKPLGDEPIEYICMYAMSVDYKLLHQIGSECNFFSVRHMVAI